MSPQPGIESPADKSPETQGALDVLGVFFSGLCLVHCLALPLALTLLPLTAASMFVDPRFHLWMLVGVVPVSALALFVNVRRRRAYRTAAVGLLGVVLIAFAALAHFYGELSESYETALTVIGASLLAAAHLRNFFAAHRDHGHRFLPALRR